MRTALLLAVCLAAAGCWKEIHEAAGPRAAAAPAVAARPVPAAGSGRSGSL